MEQIVVKFDAACRNVPGENCPMGLGVAVFIDDEYREDLSIAEYFTTEPPVLGTSNVGEWNALIRGLEVVESLRKHYPKNKIIIFGDSQLIVNQINMTFRIKEQNFIPFFNKAKRIKDQVRVGEIRWIPREQNTHADDLSKMGLYEMAPKKRFFIRGIHEGSGGEFTEFESDDLQEIKKAYWEIDFDQAMIDVVDYYIIDRKTNKNIIPDLWEQN